MSNDNRRSRYGSKPSEEGIPGRTESWDELSDQRADLTAQIEAGDQIGAYEIVDLVGAGGMGRVYAALDSRLGRRVALKVLAGELASDPRLLQRWQREAETVAALNHPNIVSLFSVEEVDGIRFFTMELVEGRSLDKLIPKRGMTLQQFFEVAIPLTDALAAAHGQNVAHRDLKPGNIMVSKQGWIKVLDFGLAKLVNDPSVEDADPHTEPLTREGLVIGTLPYMSPEQVQGEPVDLRTDIFSLGAVLYEMASGRRPFAGKSSAGLISAILRDDPSQIGDLNHELPRHLGRIIHHCLEKEPERRYQSAIEVRNELAGLQKEVETGVVSGTVRQQARTERWRLDVGGFALRTLWALVLPAVLFAGLTGQLALWGLERSLEAQILDADILSTKPLFWASSFVQQTLASMLSPGALGWAQIPGLLVLVATLFLLLARPERGPPTSSHGSTPTGGSATGYVWDNDPRQGLLERYHAKLYHQLSLPLLSVLVLVVFVSQAQTLWWLGAFLVVMLAYLFYLIRYPEDLLGGGLGQRVSYLSAALVFVALVFFLPFKYGRDYFDVEHPPLVTRARSTGATEFESFERSGEMTVVVDESDRVLATIELNEQGKLVSLSQVDAFEPRPQSQSLRTLVTTIQESERHDAKAIAGKWLD